MNHRIRLKKLSKTPAHRKAMIRNMLIALFKHEKIKTTLAKSKVLQRFAERMITKARVDSVANRRIVAKWVQDKEILAKLFTKIAPLFVNRKGGYTRIVKLGQRYGDASEMVYISLVEYTVKDQDINDVSSKSKSTKKKAVKASTATTVTTSSNEKNIDNEKVDVSSGTDVNKITTASDIKEDSIEDIRQENSQDNDK